MDTKDYKVFIVEGESREPLTIENISKVFLARGHYKIVTLPAGENIYMLWKKMKEDDFDTDIIEVLRESNEKIKAQLSGLSRDDFSEVFLFFDYDAHQTNLGKNDDKDAVSQMLINFDNETENGKLYISYPMVEALRDYRLGICGKAEACYVTVDGMKDYKNLSSIRSANPQFREYDFEDWRDIIDVFAMRVTCLFGLSDTLEYRQYSEMASPYKIHIFEEKEIANRRVFVLSAFPEFLVDYFGVRLWKTCVKHHKNQRATQASCK